MKIKRFENHFTQSPNYMLRDKRLSLKAKGMWSYIQSMPDNWDFSSVRMKEDSKDELKSTQKAIKELENIGYLVRKRHPDGKMDYELRGCPEGENPYYNIEEPLGQKGLEPKRLKAKKAYIKNKEIIQIKNTNTNMDIAPFSIQEEIKKLEDSTRRDFNIIALYFESRKPKFENREQYNSAFKRHLKDASEIKSFSDEQILKALAYAKKEYQEIYTIRTLLKILTK